MGLFWAKIRDFLHFSGKIQNRAPPQIFGIGKGFPNPRISLFTPPCAAKGFYKRAGGRGPGGTSLQLYTANRRLATKILIFGVFVIFNKIIKLIKFILSCINLSGLNIEE